MENTDMEGVNTKILKGEKMPQGYGLSGMFGRGAGRGAEAGTGRMRGKRRGAASECICPQCGWRLPHRRGIPCFEERCPTEAAMWKKFYLL